MYTVFIGTISGSEIDGEHVNQQEEVIADIIGAQAKPTAGADGLRPCPRRGQSSPSNEQQDGVRTGGNLLAPGVVRAGEASRGEEFVDTSVNAGPRKFSSIKQAVPKLRGKPGNSPVWSKRFELLVSMSGCLGSLLKDIDVAVGDTTKDTQCFVLHGLAHAHIRSARVAWICLT